MKHSRQNIDQYLQMYPQLQKWVSICPLCGVRGRKPQMPEYIGLDGEFAGEIAAKNLRKMLPELEVDEDGFCGICARLYHK